MSLDDDISRLSRVDLFEGFPVEQLRMLAFGSRRLFLRAGEKLFEVGSVSDGGYLIVSGQIDILADRNGREMVLSSQLENSLIGEMALITANRRPVTAMARTNCELLHVPRELFKRMLGEYPELAALVKSRIEQTVRQMLEDMQRVETRLQTIPDLSVATVSNEENDHVRDTQFDRQEDAGGPPNPDQSGQ